MTHFRFLCAVIALLLVFDLYPYSRDSRFWPWLQKQYSRTCQKQSRFFPYPFIMTGNDAFGDNDRNKGIPEIYGVYDQANEEAALREIGKPTDLFIRFPQLEGTKIIWNIKGKLQAQGVGFAYDQKVWRWFSLGCAWGFMHVFSRQEFEPSKDVIARLGSVSDIRELDDIRREMNERLELQGPKWSASGVTDMDCYIRFGSVWDYVLKFRKIDAGIKFGVLVPSGVTRDEFNPASVPFGSNGLWGIYVSHDSEFELKEDWKVGTLLQFIHRFPKVRDLRLPIQNEQQLFGAVVVPAEIDPGFSFIFGPYLRLEGIRDGFGLGLKYTLIMHEEDTITDARTGERIPQLTLNTVNELSQFRSEYASFTLFYDFAKVKVTNSFKPSFYFTWDLPFRFLAAENSAKTNRVTFGLQWLY